MYELAIIAVIVLFVIAARQQKRLNRVEADLIALRKSYEEGARPAVAAVEAASTPSISELAEPLFSAKEPVEAGEAAPPETDDAIEDADGPWGKTAVAAKAEAEEIATAPVPEKARRDIETALGTRWAVWVGGVALALGGLFLVRYTIEAGIFGPRVRLTMAALFGMLLVAAGEFVRRRGWKVPVAGAAAAYIPAILTAAGAFTLFGAIFAAHAVYGFLGAASAFFLLGIIAVATIVAALVHGQALAGIGLLGALATPALVSSQSPNAWALFGYLAIVLVAAAIIARMRRWRFLISAVFVGTGIWTLLYLGAIPVQAPMVVTVFSAVVLAVLVFIWLSAPGDKDDRADLVSIIPAFFTGVTALFMFVIASASPWQPAFIVAMMVVAAFWRPASVATLHAAGIVTVLASIQMMPVFDLYAGWSAGPVMIDGVARMVRGGFTLPVSLFLGLLLLAAGFVAARRHLLRSPWLSATWVFWAVTVPLMLLVSSWVTFGNIDQDYLRAGVALLLCLGFVAAGEWLARAEQPPLAGGAAVSCALAGATADALLFLHMGFGSGMTTVLAGAFAVIPALATRHRSYPVLGWLSAAALVTVLARVAFDPTIVGAEFLSRTPVFNWLLPGYGVPALAFGFAAWQLARTTAGRPRLIMEAGSALFALLTVAMLVRHAMHGGVISSGAPTLAEQAIYTLIALGAGGILISLDMRSPSSVLRVGSLAAGVVSALFICGQHFIALNPLVTDESTGRIPVFNLLFLAYLLPAVAAFALAWYARGKRPKWYSAMLALLGALLAFAYATLSVRRLFKGEYIAWWSGMEQVETYSYSALWLAMGVVLLVAGVRFGSQVLRIASAALISIAVLKVFLFDMSELEGVLRALSFIGLGGVLIGIGLFYQRLLTRSAAAGRSEV
ncbi:DUF2339 domain-containing protein [Aquamicrobium sp.]|uniref:DUF2339 domain-containing protein n=1 Tax=Aquamicrobium sp. TaxID=1872579 RepID=UPI00258B6CD1|nr:DUF2339 domain-containing protein [Aquamicrobium sp.]MCK9549874.1 DUF2339 domain-containing protein [Aquamicrobium sp.]